MTKSAKAPKEQHIYGSISSLDLDKLAQFRKLLSDSKKTGASSDVAFNRALEIFMTPRSPMLLCPNQRQYIRYPLVSQPRKTDNEDQRNYECFSSKGNGTGWANSSALDRK